MQSIPTTPPAPHEAHGLASPLGEQEAWRLALAVGLPYWIAICAVRIFSFELTAMEDSDFIVPMLPRVLQHVITAMLAVCGYALALHRGWRGAWPALSQLLLAAIVASSARPLLVTLGAAFMPATPLTLAENLNGFGGRLWLSTALEFFSVYALGLVLLIGARSVLALRDQQLEAAALRNGWMQARLQALRMQLSPHFFFNSLNTVSSLVDSNPERARRLVVSIGDLFRRALAAGNSEWTTLDDEIRFARDYLDIQGARFESRLNYQIDLDPATLAVRVPVMLLQPLVENAVTHGLADDRDTLEVWIRTDSGHRGGLHLLGIEVGNRSTGAIASGRGAPGVGLSNTQSRLAVIYQGAATLAWRQPDPGSFIVSVSLPLDGPLDEPPA